MVISTKVTDVDICTKVIDAWNKRALFMNIDLSNHHNAAICPYCTEKAITPLKDLQKVREALKPFAEFANTLKEWRISNKYVFNAHEKWPEHIPVLTRTYPCDDKSEYVRKLYAEDFFRAEKHLKLIDQMMGER